MDTIDGKTKVTTRGPVGWSQGRAGLRWNNDSPGTKAYISCMESSTIETKAVDPVVEVLAPDVQALPVVLASPHSGRCYPAPFLASSRLDPLTLRRSEDGFVDEIFAEASRHGAPLLRALFPRALLDTNREAFELDPDMFVESLPPYVNTHSTRVSAGLGTIARIVAHGQEIYREKLSFGEALNRVESFYRPYHRALARLIDQTLQRFGYCILVDCHSMPSRSDVPASSYHDTGRLPDFVLGDCHGHACSSVVIGTAAAWLGRRGYAVRCNSPYAGGFTTRHYGRPVVGVHALQVEINRALYMDEAVVARKPCLTRFAEEMTGLVEALAKIDGDLLLPHA